VVAPTFVGSGTELTGEVSSDSSPAARNAAPASRRPNALVLSRIRSASFGVRLGRYERSAARTLVTTGVEYEVELATRAGADEVERLVRVVDDVAEIPKTLRIGTTVLRRS